MGIWGHEWSASYADSDTDFTDKHIITYNNNGESAQQIKSITMNMGTGRGTFTVGDTVYGNGNAITFYLYARGDSNLKSSEVQVTNVVDAYEVYTGSYPPRSDMKPQTVTFDCEVIVAAGETIYFTWGSNLLDVNDGTCFVWDYHTISGVVEDIANPNLYTFDVNGILDGVKYGDLGEFGRVNVYISDEKVGDYVNDYYNGSVPYGSTYYIEYEAINGYICNGISSQSGTVTDNTEITIDFSSRVTVNFNKNDNSGDMAEQTFVYGVAGNRFGYNTDGTPKWEQTGQFGGWDRVGYTLLGWATSASATAKQWDPYNDVTDDWIQTNQPSIDLYAVWSANSYTVTLNANGGSCTPNTLSVIYGSTYGTLPTPTKTGHTFIGWFDELTGGTRKYATDLYTISGNSTLYAYWRANILSVQYKSGGGFIEAGPYEIDTNDYIHSEGDSSIFKQEWTYNSPKDGGLYNNTTFSLFKSGCIFEGWGTTASGDIIFDQNNSSLTPTDLSSAISSGDTTITLYAIWQGNHFKVTFDANGGKFADGETKKEQTVPYNGTAELPEDPTQVGKVFKGWMGSYTNVKSNVTVKAMWDTSPIWIREGGVWVKLIH